jgi:hypothetical protein
MRTCYTLLLLSGLAFARTEFWAPLNPPRAHYTAEVKYDPETSRFEGMETIRFRNDAGRGIGRVALEWSGDKLAVAVNGAALSRSAGKTSPVLFDLPVDLAPGKEIALTVSFGDAWKLNTKTATMLSPQAVPRLWWGSWSLDDYEVRLSAPEGYAWATSGRYDAGRRLYVADGARSFGALSGKDMRLKRPTPAACRCGRFSRRKGGLAPSCC